MMCFCMQGFITYIPVASTYIAIHTITMPNIACHAYHAIHTLLHIPCYIYNATHTHTKYHATHTRHLPSHTCDATHTMPYIPCHTYTQANLHTKTDAHTHIHTTYRHTDIHAYLSAYMRMYFCAYCTNVVASCCNVVTANMTACKLQCLHKTLRLGASFETNIVLGEPEWCQK